MKKISSEVSSIIDERPLHFALSDEIDHYRKFFSEDGNYFIWPTQWPDNNEREQRKLNAIKYLYLLGEVRYKVQDEITYISAKNNPISRVISNFKRRLVEAA